MTKGIKLCPSHIPNITWAMFHMLSCFELFIMHANVCLLEFEWSLNCHTIADTYRPFCNQSPIIIIELDDNAVYASCTHRHCHHSEDWFDCICIRLYLKCVTRGKCFITARSRQNSCCRGWVSSRIKDAGYKVTIAIFVETFVGSGAFLCEKLTIEL